MDVEIDDEVAYLLAVLAEQRIKIPKRLLYDLMEGRLGSLNSAAALGRVTAELYDKMPAEKIAFPDVFEVLFEATRDAFAELEAEWRARWAEEVADREARMLTGEQLQALRSKAERKRPARIPKRKRTRTAA